MLSRAGDAGRAAAAAKSKLKPISRLQRMRIIRGRIEKAERDERHDISAIMTPSRTYMGGFTRPRHLRSLAWCKGGPYYRKGKQYEVPPADAYQPHTVYLLEGRYLTAHTIGRSDVLEHIVGVCRESDLMDIVKKHNSEHMDGKSFRAMDFAQWPWLPRKRSKRARWWKNGEDPEVMLKDIRDWAQALGLETVTGPADAAATAPHPVPAPTTSVTHGQQIRAFHTSACVLTPTSYNEDHVVPDFYVRHKQHRAKQASEESSATPPSAPAPSTPPAPARSRKHEAAGLMQHLSDSILSDEIAASTRRLKTKIPVEHYDAQGNLILHPSGFVVPGNGHSSTSDVARAKERQRDEDEDRAAQTAAVAERVLESDFDHVHAAMASTRPRSHKVPFEVREPDGVVKHPSGFVPPTPAHEFKYSDSASLDRDLSAAVGRQRAREASGGKDRRGLHTSAVSCASVSDAPVSARFTAPPFPKPSRSPQAKVIPDSKYRKLIKGTKATPNPNLKKVAKKLKRKRALEYQRTPPDLKLLPALEEEPLDLRPYSGVKQHKKAQNPIEIRKQYLPTLEQTPFFRPLLAITLASRPLANVFARLSRAGPRGVAYPAAIAAEERRYGLSFSTRVRNLRLNRMQDLSMTLAQLLLGARGGLMGMRFSHLERGRGVNGEGFAKPLPWEKRVIWVGVGNWYTRAEEIKEGFKEDGELVNKLFAVDEDAEPVFKVCGLDEWGRRIADETGEEIPYPPKPPPGIPPTVLAQGRLEAMEAAEAAAKKSDETV